MEDKLLGLNLSMDPGGKERCLGCNKADKRAKDGGYGGLRKMI